MARGVGGNKAALHAVLWALAMLWACDTAEFETGSDSGTKGTSGAESCPARALCGMTCRVPADCENGRGGHRCLPNAPGSKLQAVNDVTRSMDDSRTPPAMSTRNMEDAGEDLDAGPDDASRRRVELARGYCARACDTELCTDPQMVCSSPDGICRKGCDEYRPTCEAGQVCDFSSKKKLCFDLDARCTSAIGCPLFDERLGLRGTVSCEDQRCRYRAHPPDRVMASRSAVVGEATQTLAVQAPLPGTRILSAQLPEFTFQFNVPAQVIVATILTREIKNLDDAAAAAIWVAYLDSPQALSGVTLAEGGEMTDGVWHAYAGAMPKLPVDQQLYFFVLGYDQGRRVAQSELIPFSVGMPRPEPGDECSSHGDFCGAIACRDASACPLGSALLCIEGVCRTPCLSNDDCAAEGRSCSEPQLYGVPARVCM